MTRKQLLPPELLEKIPVLFSQDNIKSKDKIIRVKYFLANFTWLVTECNVKEKDVLFYGYVINHSDPDCSEWGCFTLSELMRAKFLGCLGVERDLYFNPCTFGEYMENLEADKT
jgi:hypothetical protein